jgi:glycosyltransferase involved in cell wall biosynthesis
MIIGVNLLPLRMEGGGTRHFAESLLLELTTPPFSARHLLLLFCLPDLKDHIENLFVEASNTSVFSLSSAEELTKFSELFDLYFCPLNALYPIFRSRPSVACLMDIQEQYLPGNFSPRELELRASLYPSLIHDSTIACTISEYCSQTFVDKLGADRTALSVVRLYPQKRLLEATPIAIEGCPDNFFLYPANWYAHKNVRNLVLGFLEAKKSMPNLPSLVLVGHSMADSGSWFQEISDNEPGAREITVYTEISAGELRGLYEKARFVVLPTLFEGYCMPLAEAIIFRRPVLANDLPVMREIGEEWPVYSKMETSGQIARALILMMSEQHDPNNSRKLPSNLADWGWRQIAWEYETIFNQALVRYRIENVIP